VRAPGSFLVEDSLEPAETTTPISRRQNCVWRRVHGRVP